MFDLSKPNPREDSQLCPHPRASQQLLPTPTSPCWGSISSLHGPAVLLMAEVGTVPRAAQDESPASQRPRWPRSESRCVQDPLHMGAASGAASSRLQRLPLHLETLLTLNCF